MNKLITEDIKQGSLITHLNVLSSDEGTAYEIRASFTLKSGEIFRVTISRYDKSAQMDFCVRKSTGDYISHLQYEFAPGILNRCLNKMFSEYIKDVSGKDRFTNSDILDVINKIRKNYLDCTPILNIT